MRRRISTLLLSFCCLALAAQTAADVPAQAAAPLRFGVLSYQSALEAMPEYAAVQKDMAQLREKYEAEAKRAETEFNNKYEDFLDGQRDFPQTILLKRQSELQELMAKNVQFREESRKLLEAARTDALAPLHKKLATMLRVIGEKEGYAFILNTDGDACPYIAPSQGTDITQVVVSALKNK